MRNSWLDEAQAGIKVIGRNINNLRYADDTTLMAESEELKSLLMKVKEETERVMGIRSHYFMGNRWVNSGNSGRLYFGGAPKSLQRVTAAVKLKDTSWNKSYHNLDNIFKSRDITLPTKVHLVKAVVFPVVIYGCKFGL